MWNRIKQVLIALDQLLNTLLKGYADETLSSRAYRLRVERGRVWPERIINAVFFFDDNHCEESYQSEIQRRQLPPSLRK